MRITGGCYRGRKVACPSGIIRPAMDRMRESMFSILGDLGGLSFLDLFAGSGVVALEALSRGAARTTLVEKDAGKRRTIMKNLTIAEDVSGTKPATLVIRPVERFLRPGMERFDVIHLDPPLSHEREDPISYPCGKGRSTRAGGHFDDSPSLRGEHRYRSGPFTTLRSAKLRPIDTRLLHPKRLIRL